MTIVGIAGDVRMVVLDPKPAERSPGIMPVTAEDRDFVTVTEPAAACRNVLVSTK